MEFKHILLTVSGRTGIISLNRPEKRNALNPLMVDELKQAFTHCFENDEVKVIKIRAEGDVFCAGADLAVIRAMRDATYDENLEDSQSLAALFSIIHKGEKPVVAAVHGHAIAGGCGLAAVCDIVIASGPAKFGYTETRIGFVPAIVARFLMRKTGETHARDLLLSGRLISAEEAARIGLVTETVPTDSFNEHVKNRIDDLVNKCSGEAMAATKTLINTVGDLSFDEALEYAAKLNAKARESKDCKSGIQAFLNKEKISW